MARIARCIYESVISHVIKYTVESSRRWRLAHKAATRQGYVVFENSKGGSVSDISNLRLHNPTSATRS
jgi:hypothetical protein